jgi:hypothetical protein
VDVAVGGVGLGVKVTVAAGGGAVTVTVKGMSVGAEQAESPKRSESKVVWIIA